jgi:MOSC domain-containing protein YiiM
MSESSVTCRLLGVHAATVQPLRVAGGRTVMSGIGKQAVVGGVCRVERLGLVGDEQADPTVHGGLAKAVYAYPSEHAAMWRQARLEAGVASLWDQDELASSGEVPSASLVGENLALAGLLESQVWIGDRLVLPDCELVVTEPRFPCFKFNAAMGWSGAARQMARTGACGWYLSVARAGRLAAGQTVELVPGARRVRLSEVFAAQVRRRVEL